MDGQYWKGDRTMSTNEWLLTSDNWQFLEPWHGRWYEYEIFIASCTDNIYDLENERWLLGDMIDHVGIDGSRVAEGLSASNAGLVFLVVLTAYQGNPFGQIPVMTPLQDPWGSHVSYKYYMYYHCKMNSKKFQWQTNFVYPESEHTLWWEVF